MVNINNILKDLSMDFWTYISLGFLKQKNVAHEIGSSTMPHKINPWRLEVAEGSAAEANAKFIGFINKLQISRLQRDLSDHEAQRAMGVGFAHSYLTVLHVLEELARLEVNREKISQEINNYGSVLTEAVQTLLRKEGYEQPYELMKDFSRGKHCTLQELHAFIDNLTISEETKQKIKSLRPENYVGLSKELTELTVRKWEEFKEEYEEPLPAVRKVFLAGEAKTFDIVDKLKSMEIEVLEEFVPEQGLLYIGPIDEQFKQAKEAGMICVNYDPKRKTKADYNIVDLEELPDLISSFGGD